MTVFKRLCRKLLRLNRDIEYTKKCFSASHHPECKGRHKIIIKMKILSKCFLVFEVHIVGYGVHKSNLFLSGGRVGCYISYIELMSDSQV